MTNEDKYREKFLGKKVVVIDSKGEEWVGRCEFIGFNPYLPSYGFQVTINRTPITNVDPFKVELWSKEAESKS